jgi:GTPase SAR1 family protein
VPEIQHHAPNVPILLIGTKLDLREDRDTIDKLRERRMQPIDYQAGAALARQISAVRCVAAASPSAAQMADRAPQLPRVLRADAKGPQERL